MRLIDIKRLILRGPYVGYINLDSGHGLYLPAAGVTIVDQGDGAWKVVCRADHANIYRIATNEEELNEALLEARK